MKNKPSRVLLFLLLLGVLLAIGGVRAAVSVPEVRYYEYLTQPGDTLAGIAQRHLADPRQLGSLRKINKLTDAGPVKAGIFLRIPVAAMRQEPASATVLATQGPASANDQAIKLGGALGEAADLVTGDGGFAAIRLPNNSVVALMPNTRLRLTLLRQLGNTGGIPDYLFDLAGGRVEIVATNPAVATARFQIRTRPARVNVSEGSLRVAYDAGTERAQAEVIAGADTLHRYTIKPKAALLRAGFGSPASMAIEPFAAALLPAPRLDEAKNAFTSSTAHIEALPLRGAVSYRAAIAKDAAFTEMVAERFSSLPRFDFVALPQGELFLRVRAIDAAGLQGMDSVLKFQTRPMPAAPRLLQPANGASIPPAALTFGWSVSAGADKYRLQLARTDKFAELLLDQETGGLSLALEQPLAAGNYFWRVAALRDGEAGPFSDIGKFSVRRAPAKLEIPETRGGEMRFAWAGDAGERYQFQLSRNERFTDIVVERMLDTPEVIVNDLAKNVYYMRVRSIDRPAGAAEAEYGPWSEIQQVEVYGSNWRFMLFGLPNL